MEFEAALREHRTATAAASDEKKALETRYKLTTLHAFRARYRRAKLPSLHASDGMLKLQKKDEELWQGVRDQFEPLAAAMGERHDAEKKARQKRLDQLAEGYVVRRTEDMTLYRWVYAGAYRSTGRGDQYAQQAAQSAVDHLEVWGIRAEIRSGSLGPEVWAGTDDYGVEALKRKPGLTLREQVRRCWARNVNPRVFNPFLPHGYEERMGIDYQGRERRVASCTALVLVG